MASKYSLHWDKFGENLITSYASLRHEGHFSDVTLLSDDEVSFSAHKLVLAGSSQFFQNILKKNSHLHPLLYLHGVSSEFLANILDFIYEGKVEVKHENLDEFLTAAEKFKIQGLSKTEEISATPFAEIDTLPELQQGAYESELNVLKEIFDNEHNGKLDVMIKSEQESKVDTGIVSQSHIQVQETKVKPEQRSVVKREFGDSESIPHVARTYCYEKIPITDVSQIKTMIMELSEKVGKLWRCKFCGKTTASAKRNELSTHIESHFDGLAYPCTHCPKTSKNRSALRGHMYRDHKAVPDPNLQPTIFRYPNAAII